MLRLRRWCRKIWYCKILSWIDSHIPASITRRLGYDPLLALRGSGKHIWADEHADEYVANLRKDWG
jgi:hypothetical protein